MEKMLTTRDYELVNRLITFSNGLIIKDQTYADSLETITSQRNASYYISAYLGMNGLTEEQNKPIIEFYEEKNEYYKTLQMNYDIAPAISRQAKHLSILECTNKTLTKSEEKLFYTCYYNSLNYYNTAISTEGFYFHKNFYNFLKLFLVWSTIMKFLNEQLADYFNVDVYDLRTLKNAFISVDLDYFDDLPISYQRKLLKKVNDIIINKGTEKCFMEILSVFGLNNVFIYKYTLVKKFISDGKGGRIPVLNFYKTKSKDKLNIKQDESFTFEEFTENDIYWTATKEEVLNKNFNSIVTKYISIESAMDFNKDVLSLSYFIKLMFDYKNKFRNNALYFYNKNISNTKIDLFNAFICMISLSLKMNGYKDNIIKNIDTINFIYGYNNEELDISELINSIKKELELDYTILEKDKDDLLAFINIIQIKNPDKDNLSIDSFIQDYLYNENIRTTLDEWIYNSNNINIVNSLTKIKEMYFVSRINVKLFEHYDTYSQYLADNDLNLYNYVNVNSSNDEISRFKEYKAKIIELCESISSYIEDDSIGSALSHNPMFGVNNYLQYYINTLVLLFKSYTMELRNTEINYSIDDKNDNNIRLRDSIKKTICKREAEYIGLTDSIIIKNGKGDII